MERKIAGIPIRTERQKTRSHSYDLHIQFTHDGIKKDCLKERTVHLTGASKKSHITNDLVEEKLSEVIPELKDKFDGLEIIYIKVEERATIIKGAPKSEWYELKCDKCGETKLTMMDYDIDSKHYTCPKDSWEDEDDKRGHWQLVEDSEYGGEQ